MHEPLSADHSRLMPYLELEDGRSYGVKIRQAAPVEVRLDIAARVDSGTMALLRIDDERGVTWFRSAVEIHWTEPFPGGTSAGLYLSQPFSEDLLAWPEWDRRETIRYAIDLPARIWWSGARSGASGRIINYSSSGVGILCDRPVVELGIPAIIVTDTSRDKAICATGTPCWQVQATDGIMIGFELEPQQGRRFGDVPSRTARPLRLREADASPPQSLSLFGPSVSRESAYDPDFP